MVLNKQKGNMYPWVTHTWNPIKGKCPHNCSYCYMKKFKVGELRLDEKALKDNLGHRNFVFVGSSTDMWADYVKIEWIKEVLKVCLSQPSNTFLFQTKNPKRFIEFTNWFPSNSILGITLESNRDYELSKAPKPYERVMVMRNIGIKKMVSIEPILDFDFKEFTDMIKLIDPVFVSIGADSQSHNLPEPSPGKAYALITELKAFTEVKVKDNLQRIMV